MYLSSVHITNFRCFQDKRVDFSPGITVLIGENNAGKTSLLRSLALVLERGNPRRPSVDDFAKTLQPSVTPPRIAVAVTLRSTESDTTQDRALVSTWLTQMAPVWEAQLTYEFFLPAEHDEEFAKHVGESPTAESFRFAIERLLPKYVSRIWGGNPTEQRRAEPEFLEKIGFKLLGALRDVDEEMFRGRNSVLRSVLKDILDRRPKDRAVETASRASFRESSKALVSGLLDRLDQESLFALVSKTGAQDGGQPKLGGSVREEDLLAALVLLLEKRGFEIPASHNGLGYNNLIYIALVLASIEFATEDTQGQNAPVFPLLVIEEPEAHLHPAMQYKLLRYLKQRVLEGKASRQILVTTHSTHVTAASSLDNLVCLSLREVGDIHVAYPGKAFAKTAEGRTSKAYVERYLDATKSSMLFAKGVVFVEGMAENLVLPVFAEYLGSSLEDHHVAVVPVGGLTFHHFLPLFGHALDPALRPYGLDRRVACVLDADPGRKEEGSGARWKACFEFELNQGSFAEYRKLSPSVTSLSALVKGYPWLSVQHGSQTFEYDLAVMNADSSLLLTENCTNRKELEALQADPAQETADLWLESSEKAALEAAASPPSTSVRRFAACYIRSVGNAKGSHAFALARNLRENLAKDTSERAPFQVPSYLEAAIRWTCGTELPAPRTESESYGSAA